MPVAAFATLLMAVAGVDDLQSVAIWDKAQLRIWCLIGSMMGAFLAIAVIPSPNALVGNYHRRLAMKFASSMILGVAITPIVIRWRGWPVDTDVVMAASCGVAMLAVGTLSALYPLYLKWVLAKIGSVQDICDTPSGDKKP